MTKTVSKLHTRVAQNYSFEENIFGFVEKVSDERTHDSETEPLFEVAHGSFIPEKETGLQGKGAGDGDREMRRAVLSCWSRNADPVGHLENRHLR